MSEELKPCPFCPQGESCECPPDWCDCGGTAICAGHRKEQDAELADLREKLAAVEEKRDTWLRIAQRLFKERQTLLHGHVYDLPTDDVILEASILEALDKGAKE